MHTTYSLFICIVLLLVASCRPTTETPRQTTCEEDDMYLSHAPQHPDDFITALVELREDSEAHQAIQSLYTKYPVYYDWWLQDGDDFFWFRHDLQAEIKKRPQRLGLDTHFEDTPGGIQAAILHYLEACTQRRETRLAGWLETTPRIAFTKFEVLRPSFFAYTEGLSDARNECNFFPNGALALFEMEGIWAREETLLKDPAGVFRDPDVHFDGNHLLFAWKKSAKEDDFHLHEMEFPSREVKQLTSGAGFADIEPIYLPDGNILFNSTRNGNSVDCWMVEVSTLFVCDREGKYLRRVGYDQVHTVKPAMLDDGRVIYTRWEYNDRGQIYTQPLFQMNPDGTGQSEYYGGNSVFPTTLVHARQIPGTRKVMAVFTGHHTPQHGKLGIIDPEAGRDENEGTLLVAPVRKPEAVSIDGYGQYSDQFQYPWPLNETDFLVSYSPLGYYTGRPIDFGIYWMNVDGERELLVSDPTLSCNQPVVLAPRKRPFTRATTVDYRKEDGVYYMQNVYAGKGVEGIEPGTIKKLRVVELLFRPASVGAAFGTGKGGSGHAFTPVGVGNATWDVKRILGTIDIEEDGSALFQVPARSPLYFQALDENDRVVQTMRSWSTLQPGEIQSCVGCHEHKNSVPLAAHPVSQAMNKPVQPIRPEGRDERTFSYIQEVQPIWDAHCIACHNGVNHAMSLKGDLKVVEGQTKRKFSDSYLNLTHARPWTPDNESWQGQPDHPEVNWISSLSEPTLLKPYHAGSHTSNLIKRLENGHQGTRLSKEEIATVSLWLDLCVPFVGDYREANNWTEEEEAYYTYYEKKAEKARLENEENIRLYIEHLLSQK